MECLRAELIMEILSRVPTLDLLKLSSVCRRWRNIILNDPLFQRLHHTHVMSKPNENVVLLLKRGSKLDWVDLTDKTSPRQVAFNLPRIPDFSDYDFIGSCNGLLCLASWKYLSILVMNPFARHHLLIPMPGEIRKDFFVRWGFGFDGATNSYKVVVVFSPRFISNDGVEVRVYDLGSPNSINWRSIRVTNFTCGKFMGNSCFYNGRLHWTYGTGDSFNIISFDLADEEFKLIPTPDCPLLLKALYNHLIVLGGCLCILNAKFQKRPKLLIWVMREYGIKASWVMEFNTYPSTSTCSNSDLTALKALGSGKDGELILSEVCVRRCGVDILLSSDSTYEEFKRLHLEMRPEWNGSIIHTATLNWI